MTRRRLFDGAQEEVGSLPIESLALSPIVLSQIASTTLIFNPAVVRESTLPIAVNRIESNAQILLPTIISAATTQTIVLNTLGPSSNIFLVTIPSDGGILDRSDVLNRSNREEEAIAAHILKQRQNKSRKQVKKEIDWKNQIIAKINGAETLEQLDEIVRQYQEVDVAVKALEAVKRREETKRLELEIAKKEAELKLLELKTEAQQQKAAYEAKLKEQQEALRNAKRIQDEVFARQKLAIENAIKEEKRVLLQVMERRDIAVQKAIELEREAYLAHYKAEQEAIEFTRKRNNRIKRLRALMWLAKLDI